MKSIFDKAMLGNLPTKNRLVQSATAHMYMADSGTYTEPFYDTYEQLAKGGVGTIIVELAEMIQNRHNDSLLPQYRRLTNIIHAEQANAILQIGLVEYYEKGQHPIAPTNVTKAQIQDIINLFVETSVRAKAGGFDGVQIHAGHFLFLSRFISPAQNRRTDEYGGGTENRSRIIVEILRAIKKAVPDFHVSIKLNFNDFVKGGLLPQDSIEISKLLVDAGIDSIEVTANGTSQERIKAGENEGYFYEYGKALAELVNVSVIVVGGYRSVEYMDTLLNNSRIEFFSMSRPLIREPDLMNRWQSGDVSPAACISCNGCYTTKNSRCIFRAQENE